MSRMNKKQRFIASCSNPYFNNFASKKEVKLAKKLARGKYWIEYLQFGRPKSEEDFENFCAYSPSGKRYFFCFNWFSGANNKQRLRWKKEARKAARLWCKGKYKEALKIHYDSYWNSSNE